MTSNNYQFMFLSNTFKNQSYVMGKEELKKPCGLPGKIQLTGMKKLLKYIREIYN